MLKSYTALDAAQIKGPGIHLHTRKSVPVPTLPPDWALITKALKAEFNALTRISSTQSSSPQELAMKFRDKGMTQRQARLMLVAMLTERELKSFSDLSISETQALFSILDSESLPLLKQAYDNGLKAWVKSGEIRIHRKTREALGISA